MRQLAVLAICAIKKNVNFTNMNFFEKLKAIFVPSGTVRTSVPSATTNNGDANIIAARIQSITKHPNADRLQVVSLFDGTKTIEPVVCGGKNIAVGQIVALALPGAHIPHNIHSDEHESFTLGTATIRGVESRGMICAAFELGKSTEIGYGIMILPEDTQLGTIVA